MTHWRLLGDFRLGAASAVLSVLDAQIVTLSNMASEEEIDPDDAIDSTEHMLGLGFVTLQDYLRSVAQTLRIVREASRRDDPSTLGPPAMHLLLRQSNELVGGTGVHQLEAAWAAANFWKHRDEWPEDWSSGVLAGPTAGTIRTLEALGIGPQDERPMWNITALLGSGGRMVPVLEIAERWRAAVLATA